MRVPTRARKIRGPQWTGAVASKGPSDRSMSFSCSSASFCDKKGVEARFDTEPRSFT